MRKEIIGHGTDLSQANLNSTTLSFVVKLNKVSGLGATKFSDFSEKASGGSFINPIFKQEDK